MWGPDQCRPLPPNKIGSLLNIGGFGPPQTNLDPRLELSSIGGIRIDSVMDQKGFRRHSERFPLNHTQNFCFLPRNSAQLRFPNESGGDE